MPGRRRTIREREHVADRHFVGLALAPVAPVFRVHLVPLVRRRFAFPETAQLLLVGNVQPVLHHDPTVLGELPLEIVDLPECPPPVVLAAKALDPFHQNAAIPGAVEDRHAAVRRDLPPKPPEVVGLFLLGRGLGDRNHRVVARVDGARQPANRPAFAGGVPTLEDEHDRPAGRQGRAERLVQAAQPLLPQRVILLFRKILVERERLQPFQTGRPQRTHRARPLEPGEAIDAFLVLLELAQQQPADGKISGALVFRVDGRPACAGLVGLGADEAGRAGHAVVDEMVMPVFLGHPPRGGGIRPQLAQAATLRLL